MKELVNRKVQMWLSLCCIHVIIKYYELRKYTNEKIENRVLKATNKIEKAVPLVRSARG